METLRGLEYRKTTTCPLRKLYNVLGNLRKKHPNPLPQPLQWFNAVSDGTPGATVLVFKKAAE
jgi:hypothetical protein